MVARVMPVRPRTGLRCDIAATVRDAIHAVTSESTGRRGAMADAAIVCGPPFRCQYGAKRGTDQNAVRGVQGCCRSRPWSVDLQRSASDVRPRRKCRVAPARYSQNNAASNATSRNLQRGVKAWRSFDVPARFLGHHVRAFQRAGHRRRQGPKAPRKRGVGAKRRALQGAEHSSTLGRVMAGC